MPATYRAPDVGRCRSCGRTLHDPASITAGYGPVCRRALQPPTTAAPKPRGPTRRPPDYHAIEAAGQLALTESPHGPSQARAHPTQPDHPHPEHNAAHAAIQEP